ncbi:MAG: chloride channel protein, partial [Lachnospiraceae bacterium]|nr:chloride channel protein [Lachnospiraceae bacterium]
MKQGQERSYGSDQQQKRLIGQAAFWKRVRSLPYGKLTDGIIVGAIGGGAAILFRFLLHQVSSRGQQMYSLLRANSLLLAPALVVVIGFGLLAGWLVEKAPLSSGSGIPQVVGILQGDLKTRPWPILVSKYVGGLASNLIGMSLGREGPSIQLGAEGAQLYAGLRQLPRSRRHMLMVAGAAAGLSAAFNAPLAAVVFTVEELRKEFREKELPIIAVASLTADFLSKMAFGWQPSFIFAAVPKLGRLPMRFLIGLPILALLCGVLGCLFNIV